MKVDRRAVRGDRARRRRDRARRRGRWRRRPTTRSLEQARALARRDARARDDGVRVQERLRAVGARASCARCGSAERLGDAVEQRTVATALLAHAVPGGLRRRRAGWTRSRRWRRACDVAGARHLRRVDRVLQRAPARMGAIAREHGFDLRAHVEQFARHGSVPVAIEAGARSVDHLAECDDGDVRRARRPRSAPRSCCRARSCSAPSGSRRAATLVDAGAICVLGTDCNPGTSPVVSLPLVDRPRRPALRLDGARGARGGDAERGVGAAAVGRRRLARAGQARRRRAARRAGRARRRTASATTPSRACGSAAGWCGCGPTRRGGCGVIGAATSVLLDALAADRAAASAASRGSRGRRSSPRPRTGSGRRPREAGLARRARPGGQPAGPVRPAPPPWWGVGSHLDTVREGGRFDGALGVAAGFAVARRVDAPVAVISFADEEGARFNTPTFGSRALVGRLDVDGVARRADADGVALADAMRGFGVDPAGVAAAPEWLGRLRGFLELHIDQSRDGRRARRAGRAGLAGWRRGRACASTSHGARRPRGHDADGRAPRRARRRGAADRRGDRARPPTAGRHRDAHRRRAQRARARSPPRSRCGSTAARPSPAVVDAWLARSPTAPPRASTASPSTLAVESRSRRRRVRPPACAPRWAPRRGAPEVRLLRRPRRRRPRRADPRGDAARPQRARRLATRRTRRSRSTSGGRGRASRRSLEALA